MDKLALAIDDSPIGMAGQSAAEWERRITLRRPSAIRINRSRRRLMRRTLTGSLGLTLPGIFPPTVRKAAHGADRVSGFGRAKRCIVIFNWGGMSQFESWDPKPEAPAQVRGVYNAIDTTLPGVQVGEYMPKLAQQTDRLAIVRSVKHRARDHRQALYWSLTGVPPVVLDGQMVSNPVLATREDKPMLGSMVAWARGVPNGMPPTVTLPYPVAERGLVAGQNAGFLGVRYDPLVARPKTGKPFPGVSPVSDSPNLAVDESMTGDRVAARHELLRTLGAQFGADRSSGSLNAYQHFHGLAMDLLLSRKVREAFDLKSEPDSVQKAYGDHIFGRSLLLARRLIETDIPLVMVNSGAGDLNGGAGAIWDTHVFNFPQLKNFLMPPFDHGASALLDDLELRGMLEETLVVLMTEFGRGALINHAGGRDHSPDCYSVAFAGGGVQGGQVYGRSDRFAMNVKENPCGPHDLHATIFHALGIDYHQTMAGPEGAEIPLCDGKPLPVFG